MADNTIGAKAIINEILGVVDTFTQTQTEILKRAAQKLADILFNGGVVHVFGAGHSRMFGMEMCGRAGGLVPMNLIGLEDIAVSEGKTNINLVDLERDPHTARRLWAMHDIRTEDALIIVSNSGRNGSVVELALEGNRQGLLTMAVTSKQHASRSESRHPSKQKLDEVADIVIDNCCPYGDTLLSIPNMKEKTGSASSVIGSLIAQALTSEIIAHYVARNEQPPVYISANVDSGDEHNEKIRESYAHRQISF